MAKAVDLGSVEAAASMTPGGRVKVRFLLSVEQLEALLKLARDGEGEAEVSASAVPAPPRRVRPAAPAAAAPAAAAHQSVFVREGTKAWTAWLAHKRAERPGWSLTTTHTIDGRRLTGWWFPSLFPPRGADPPAADARDDNGDDETIDAEQR